MPRVPLDHPATYDDLIALPDHVVAEILDDELYSSPRPAPRHSLATSWLGAALMPRFVGGPGAPGGWIILDEPELHLRRDVLVPDIAGWRRERMPRLPETAYFSLAPDWLCEVLSPSTATMDRGRKLRIYAREGVGHVWLVDPVVRTLEVFALHVGQWVLAGVHEGKEIVHAAPFDALGLELATSGANRKPLPRRAEDASDPSPH